MLRRVVVPYLPPVIMTAVLGTLAFNELEQHAPSQLREQMQQMRPFILLGKKSVVSSPEFSGDASPQRGVFAGADRAYSCVLVLHSGAPGTSGGNSTVQERKSLTRQVARAVLDLDGRDVDVALGLGPRVWDCVKGNVRLGNLTPHASTLASSPLHSSAAGDVLVHIKADSQSACAGAVESVLARCRHEAVAWSEDTYGYVAPPPPVPPPLGNGGEGNAHAHASNKPRPKVCPNNAHNMTTAETCSVACTPQVGTSFALVQRWEDKKPVAAAKAGAAASTTVTTISNHASRVYGLDENDQPLRIVKNTWRTGKLGSRTVEDKLGMVFVGYCANPKVFEYMVERMQGKRGGGGAGGEDTTLQLHKLTRSQLFFVPSRSQVRDMAL